MKDCDWKECKTTFRVVLYEALETTPADDCHNMFIGMQRQGIQIMCDGETWLFDNDSGIIYQVLIKGAGSSDWSYKPVKEHKVIQELPESEWYTTFNSDNYGRDANLYS